MPTLLEHQLPSNRVVGKVALFQKQARPSFRITDYSSTESRERMANDSAVVLTV